MQRKWNMSLKKWTLNTPLGEMIAVTNDTHVQGLYFADQRNLPEKIHDIVSQNTPLATALQKELCAYFAGPHVSFKIPLFLSGTPFQKKAWQALQSIPFGHTLSYGDQAQKIGNPLACRAVGSANGKNPIAILVPCHRVINKTGITGGYAGSSRRKAWLLSHEAAIKEAVTFSKV